MVNGVFGAFSIRAFDRTPDAVRDQLLRAVARVQSIAQVHSALYRGSRRSDVDFADYLRELCDSILHSLAAEGRVTLDLSAEPVTVPVDTAIPLGMLVNELVTNAIKYAFVDEGGGRIQVRLAHRGDDLELSVSDNGKGLTEEAERASDGLGMKLVRSLVDQVQGKLQVVRQPGAAFHIRFRVGGSLRRA